MPLVNKQPFKPNPIPDNLSPDHEVFYHELTNEIFTSHDAFFDRFLYCNSLIWTCSRTGKSGLTYREALDSEQQGIIKRKRGKREPTEETNGEDGAEPTKKKKKKYPYDPKKYSMPVPEGFDPSLLTPTGKIDGRKLKSKKNRQLAEELLSSAPAPPPPNADGSGKGRGKYKRKDDDGRKKEDETKRKEEDIKRKAQAQAELAKERELEAKRKKEAAALAKQLERQKREEERKKAAAFLQNWEKKCEDLERDDLRILPQPTPLICDIPEKLFGDSIFIMESLYNLHELYDFSRVYPEGISYDTLEEMLLDRQEDGALGTLIQFLLRVIFDTQPTSDGYGFDDNASKGVVSDVKPDTSSKPHQVKVENSENDTDHDHDRHQTLGSEHDDDDENEDKDVNMNDLIGSAIKAAQEVKASLSKPLPEMELNSTNVTEVLKLHLLQSGSFPKGRTIYNGWYSSREDPGLWLCMQEPDLIKKLGEVTIYDLEIDERIKILHTLIYQIFSFIKTRLYIESASEQLVELRKEYRKRAADFARWDRENFVKRMQPPKRKGEHGPVSVSDKAINGLTDQTAKSDNNHSEPSGLNGDPNECEEENGGASNFSNNQQLKSCLKANGNHPSETVLSENDEVTHSKTKKITFQTKMNGGAMDGVGLEESDINNGNNNSEKNHVGTSNNEDSEQTFEELERAFQQNMVDYEDYQRERTIRHEELNEILLSIRTSLRQNQSIYGVHPIGRDRSYRRYWLFQSLPGLFVEQDDEFLGKCLPKPTPLESLYKKLFNKDNPLMHQNEADLIRAKICDSASSSSLSERSDAQKNELKIKCETNNRDEVEQLDENGTNDQRSVTSDKAQPNDNQDVSDELEIEPSGITHEMNYCTGDHNTCAVHGRRRPTQPRWWFYHQPESIDALIESLNKRGHRESELQDILATESSLIKPFVASCPAYKLNKHILEQSGIRRSRRLKTKGTKRRRKDLD